MYVYVCMFVFYDMVQSCSVICAENAYISVITMIEFKEEKRKYERGKREGSKKRKRGEKRT